MKGDTSAAGLARSPVSRRSFVRTAALGGAIAGSGSAAGLFDAIPAGATSSLGVAGSSLVASDPDLHLLRRTTFGPTEDLLRQIRRLGRNR